MLRFKPKLKAENRRRSERLAMRGLAKILGFSKVPRTIEGVDIAHLGGGETVASVVQ